MTVAARSISNRLTATRLARSLLGTFFTVCLTGCLVVDNQTKAPADVLPVVNPAPLERDFRANNAGHTVLVAVVDSGTDYNHPALTQNIHFELDSSGRPTGAGFDFIGNDPWPAPYLARTFDIDPQAPAQQRNNSRSVRKLLNATLALAPELSVMLDPRRSIEFEAQGAAHGTHVAALVTRGDRSIGLIPYRVMPVNSEAGDAPIEVLAYRATARQVRQGIENAIARKARIINLSLGLRKRDIPESIHAEFETWKHDFKSIALANPHVVFVAAAGNDNENVKPDGDQFPCGVRAPNVLCVTATDGNGQKADFSNTVAPELTQIAALGKDVTSAYPSGFCNSEYLKYMAMSEGFDLEPALILAFANQMKRECSGEAYVKESGTSMAAPLVAGELARLSQRQPLEPAEALIKRLLMKAQGGVLQISPPKEQHLAQ
ncbi:MAG TPA: S8 family serine peptidase [Bdellovibrionales bacterium]|nr:S8 family serine peptidase [Bdellovibrionales bacterium]